MKKDFLFLDIDDTLVKSGGYRRAFFDVMRHFLDQFGQPHILVDAVFHDYLTTHNLPAEWDMLPIQIAVFLEWHAELDPECLPYQRLEAVQRLRQVGTQTDFAQFFFRTIDQAAGLLRPDFLPTEILFQECQRLKNESIFPLLWKDPILSELFLNSLNPKYSATFRWLETLVLGSGVYEDTFHLPAMTQTKSYLELYDEPIISRQNRDWIAAESGKSFYPSILTYRPTKMPHPEMAAASKYYVNTPEGERALALLGWSEEAVPVVGAGDICYLEEKYNIQRETLVKPHPVHALACMLNSVCDDRLEALELALRVWTLDQEGKHESTPLCKVFELGSRIRLTMIEDSKSGLTAVKEAARLLRRFGYDAVACLYGIRTTTGKTRILSEEATDLFNDINEALVSYKALIKS